MDALSVAAKISSGTLIPPIPENAPSIISYIMTSCFRYDPSTRPDFVSICDTLQKL